MMSQDKYYCMDPPSHGDRIFYPSRIRTTEGITNMNISTFSLSSDPLEDRLSSMFNDASIRTLTNTAFTSISDSINNKGVHQSRSTTTTSSDGNSTRSLSSGSSRKDKKDKKGRSRKTRAVGRGGVGNIINTDNLQVDYVDEADILRRHQLSAQFNPRAKISNTGRGGSGNILAASTSTSYDRSKDPDDDYEKLVHLEARKKRMHQMVSTGRGGAGNVQNHVVVDASGGVRPRSKSLGMFNATTNGKKTKSSTPTSASRPSTASTIASNASSEHYYELQDYRLATSVANTPGKKFDPYARLVDHDTNPNTPPITPTSTSPVITHNNSHSVGPNRIDNNQTPTPIQPQRLAVSSAPPVKPVWKLQYPKPNQQQQPETKYSETTAKESTHDDKDQEKKTNKGKWWKRSKKIDHDEEYVQIELAHADQHRHLHAIATDNLGQREAASHPPPPYPPPISSVAGIPKIAMRNPQIPSHISPEQDSRSLSPAESQILDEVRILAESKVHKNGHFDMYDLEEILMQARQRHQTTPAGVAYDRSSQPTPQPPQLPLPPAPPAQIPPTAWRVPPQVRTLPKQEQQHVHICEHPERLHQRREGMMNGGFNHPPASSASPANRPIQTRDHHPHPHATTITTVPPSSYYSNTLSIYRVPSSTVSDGDISEYSSVMSFERDTQSISSRSLKVSRRERQVYESPIELGPSAMQPAANIHAQNRSLVKQRSDSAIGYYNNQVQEYDELHRRQLALMAVHEEQRPKPIVVSVDDEKRGNRSLDPVNEEDGLYFIEDEEPYSSFIDL